LWRTSANAISVPIAVEIAVDRAASSMLVRMDSLTASTANASFQ
jgi:hypothetical protein